MKCQRCGCNIDKVVPFEDDHGIKNDVIHTIKTEKIVNGVIVDFRIFFVCERCWTIAIEECNIDSTPDSTE